MPKRLHERTIFSSKLFSIKELEMEFENGKRSTYEIIEKFDSCGVVPVTAKGTVLLIREYVAAHDTYVIDFPGGKVEEGVGLEEVAQKELQEELGYKAGKLDKLATLTLSPGYLTQRSTIFLGRDLIKSKLPGDEPEELQVVEYSFEELFTMIDKGDISEARTVSSIFLAHTYLKKKV